MESVLDMEKLIDEISEEKKKDQDLSNEQDELRYSNLEAHVTPLWGTNDTSIVDTLLSEKPEEDGGLTAIYGFYYQMLVFIEYMIEAMEGKWTFLALEYHDDIIAGNEKENRLSFTQVKTSKKSAVSITDSNLSVYNRTKSKQKGLVNGKKRNNSWLDKLFENAKFVKGLNLDLSFNLVTDFPIYSTQNTNIDEYFMREKDDNRIKEGTIYKNLKEECFDSEGKKIDYKIRYNLELLELLKQFEFVFKPDMVSYMRNVCSRFNEQLGDGLGIHESDVKWLIGELLSRCAARDSGPILFLNQEDIEQYRGALENRALDKADETIRTRKATKLVKKAMLHILDSISECSIKSDLNKLMESYERHLLKQFDEYLTIQSIIYRFNEGKRPLLGETRNIHNFDNNLIAFIKTSFLLYLINEEYKISTDFDGILIKEVRERPEANILRVGFLNLGLELEVEDGIEKLKEIIYATSTEQQLELLWRAPKVFTIFHGELVDDVEAKAIEIPSVPKPTVSKLDSYPRANDVMPIVTIVPEKPLKRVYSKIKRTNDIPTLKTEIQDIWESMKKE